MKKKARAARLGLWAAVFQPPWDYRHSKANEKAPLAGLQAAPKSEPGAPVASQAISDNTIIAILRERSLRTYSGSCPCPQSIDRAGRRCGKRSAYLRSAGAAHLCYDSDVTPAMVEEYRRAATGR